VIETVVVETENEPQIALEQISVEKIDRPGYWKLGWKIKNVAPHAIKLLAGRLPHGQFKSEEWHFEPAMELLAQQEANFYVPVRCAEPEGLVTENGFVILQISWQGTPWRVFVRVRVVVNARGEPSATTELITTQKLGFTGVNA
jgi:hypothetical protein